VRHVADSLTAVPLLRGRSVASLLDLGSGGGFPGIPLAATLSVERALLVDSVFKKTAFLTTVIEALGLAERVIAEPVRAEVLAMGRDRGAWAAVTARAVGSLADLVELGLPLLHERGVLIAWKRADAIGDGERGLAAEMTAARRALDTIDRGATMSVVAALPPGGAGTRDAAEGAERLPGIAELAEHCLVVIERGRGRIDAEWPRDPAVRKRRPWS
jgi:16S rRNA (guanine(527)-N(7))-methyltransferase RsmG